MTDWHDRLHQLCAQITNANDPELVCNALTEIDDILGSIMSEIGSMMSEIEWAVRSLNLPSANPAPVNAIDRLRSRRPKTTLYHYTSAAGLLGIVESKSLWTSSIRHLSETSEYSYAGAIARDFAARSLNADADHPWRDCFLDLLEISDRMLGDAMVYVASLSEAGDRLSQWRGYCPSGGGFSVGFAPELISQLAWRQGYELLRCEYDLKEQKAICEELVSEGCRIAKQREAEEDLAFQRESAGIWHGLYKPLMRFAPAIKNPRFVEEQEWRLIRGPFEGSDRTLRFRPGKYAPIPYREFELVNPLVDSPGTSRLEIEELIVGPNPDPEHAIDAVECLFAARGVNCKKISIHSGTLRN